MNVMVRFFLVAVSLSVFFTGCGGGGGSSSTLTANEMSAQVSGNRLTVEAISGGVYVGIVYQEYDTTGTYRFYDSDNNLIESGTWQAPDSDTLITTASNGRVSTAVVTDWDLRTVSWTDDGGGSGTSTVLNIVPLAFTIEMPLLELRAMQTDEFLVNENPYARMSYDGTTFRSSNPYALTFTPNSELAECAFATSIGFYFRDQQEFALLCGDDQTVVLYNSVGNVKGSYFLPAFIDNGSAQVFKIGNEIYVVNYRNTSGFWLNVVNVYTISDTATGQTFSNYLTVTPTHPNATMTDSAWTALRDIGEGYKVLLVRDTHQQDVAYITDDIYWHVLAPDGSIVDSISFYAMADWVANEYGASGASGNYTGLPTLKPYTDAQGSVVQPFSVDGVHKSLVIEPTDWFYMDTILADDPVYAESDTCGDYIPMNVDVQIETECQTAWIYGCSGNTAGVEAACQILDLWGYKSQCSYCSGF